MVKLATSLLQENLIGPIHLFIDLCSFLQVVFEGVRGRGSLSDIAIDDVLVTTGPCTSPGEHSFYHYIVYEQT